MINDDAFNNKAAVSALAVRTTRLLQDPTLLEAVKNDQSLFAMAYAALFNFYPKFMPKHEEPKDLETRKELKAVIASLEARYGTDITTKYGGLFFAGSLLFEDLTAKNDFSAWKNFLKQSQKEAVEINNDNINSFEQTIHGLTQILGLNETERNLLEFQVGRADLSFQLFYERLFNMHRRPEFTAYFLAQMFDVTLTVISDVLGKNGTLRKCGLLNFNDSTGRLGTMSESFVNWFCTASEVKANQQSGLEATFDSLVKPLSKKQSASGSIGSLTPVDKELILNLLAKSRPAVQSDKHPESTLAVNILAYGNPKIDKKSAINKMFEETNYTLYSMDLQGVPASDYPARTYIVQRWLELKHKVNEGEPILIVEQADSVLTRRGGNNFMSSLFGMSDKKEEEEETLETDEILLAENPVASIWIVDRPKNIIEENVGRFLFHCEVKPGSRADRRKEIDSIVENMDLSEEVKIYLSKYQMLSPTQVRSAARLASYIATNPTETEDVLKRGIQQSQKALQRDFMEELRESVTTYSLDFINTKSAFSPEQVLNALGKRAMGSLCLYGMPGTGKTQFAEYLAMKLDKPIIMKRASDLLDKYVGENEKNIAAMFAEATEEDAILFLDEADSFLRDRSMARAEWSVTQVNELLQQMERFKGIFIVATNLFRDIDAAALRRFTFKFEFLALTDDQRWKMFVNEAKIDESTKAAFNLGVGDAALENNDQLRADLNKIKSLTPGDFATVKRQSNLLGETLTPQQWIEQLAVEAKAKLAGLERNGMGFTAE